MSWAMVDEGWGRRAVEFATIAEPSTCREYVFVHSRLGIGSGDRLLYVACVRCFPALGVAVVVGVRGG